MGNGQLNDSIFKNGRGLNTIYGNVLKGELSNICSSYNSVETDKYFKKLIRKEVLKKLHHYG